MMSDLFLDSHTASIYNAKTSPRSYALVVRAVACEARGPVFDSCSDQMVFSLLGCEEVGIKWIQKQKLLDLAYPCRKTNS